MEVTNRFTPAKAILIAAVIGLVLFFVGFMLARATDSGSARAEAVEKRYQFMQIGDTVAAIDMQTGETYAIDGNTRAWTMLAPALPSKEPKSTR